MRLEIKKLCLLSCVYASVAVAPAFAASSPFKLADTSLHADRETPEYCLVFSKPFAASDRAALAALLTLESEGSKIALAPRDIGMANDTLCVQNLAFGQSYKLRLKNLKSVDGEALDEPVSVAFDIENRKPELAFSPFLEKEGRFPRVISAAKSGLALQSVNVQATRLSLYKIADRSAWAGVWDKYSQLDLTAFESLAYAKDKGRQVGQGDLVFSDKANARQKMDIALPVAENKLEPGLYFLYAEPKEARALETLSAGSWFIVSDLAASAVQTPEGTRVFVTSVATKKPVKGAKVSLFGASDKLVSDGRTDANGQVLLPPSEQTGLRVLAETDDGALAMLDLGRYANAAFARANADGALLTDRTAYRSGDVATVVLVARDRAGKLAASKPSSLKLLRADQSFVSEIPVQADKTGAQVVAFPLPIVRNAEKGSLLWQGADGEILGRAVLALDPNGSANETVTLNAEKPLIERDGKVSLSVAVQDANGKPLAWQGGKLSARFARPVFAAWKAYQFGVPDQAEAAPLAEASFLSQEDGEAHVDFDLPLSAKDGAVRAVKLQAETKDGAIADPVVLPLRSSDLWVGVKPAVNGQSFTEGHQAVFDCVAVDANGKRKASGDLYFNIYEEGRSFTWFQSEGQWAYKPSSEHRRIGGGRLAIPATGDAKLSWPVTAGHYVLEITQANGSVVAQLPFDASSKIGADAAQPDARFAMGASAAPLAVGQEAHWPLHLSEAASVSFVIGDGAVRVAETRYLEPGDHKIAFLPQDDWGDTLNARVEAVFASGERRLVERSFALRHPSREIDLSVALPATLNAGAAASLPVSLSRLNGKQPPVLSAVVALDEPDGGARSLVFDSVPVDKTGHAVVTFPVGEKARAARLTLVATNGTQFAQKQVTIPVNLPFALQAPSEKVLSLGDQANLSVVAFDHSAASGVYQIEATSNENIGLAGDTKVRLTLAAGQRKSFALTLSAKKEGRGLVRLDVTGPKGFKTVREIAVPVVGMAPPAFDLETQTVDPQKTFAWNGRKAEQKALLSPKPLYGTPGFVSAILKEQPITTADLSEWMQTARLWESAIIGLGFETQDGFADLLDDRAQALLTRQNPDGGFPAWPGAESDVASTAAALGALGERSSNQALMAAKWLQRKLDNAWFEEKERADRSAGFLALSLLGEDLRKKAGVADPSALRYFAETSRDKNVSALVAARLSLALASVHDDEAARFWFGRVRDVWPVFLNDDGVRAARLLPLLVINPVVTHADTAPLFAELAQGVANEPGPALAFLRAVGLSVRQNGSWHLVDKGGDKKRFGVVAIAGGANDTFENVSRDKIFVTVLTPRAETQPATTKDAATTIQRQLYKLDGERLAPDAPLSVGSDYLLVLHGTARNDAEQGKTPLLVSVPTYSALRPIVELDPETIEDMWPWLPTPRTRVKGAVFSDRAAGFMMASSPEWRVTLLVRAETAGSFALPQMDVRNAEGLALPVQQNALRLRVQVK